MQRQLVEKKNRRTIITIKQLSQTDMGLENEEEWKNKRSDRSMQKAKVTFSFVM